MYQTQKTEAADDRFKYIFKYYKSKKIPPSFDDVVIVGQDKRTSAAPAYENNDPRAFLLGLKHPKTWETFLFESHPGLLFIKNPFTSLGHRFWIRKCLEDYPQKPNKINIDIERKLENWWHECFKEGQSNDTLLKKLRWTTLGYHHDWNTKVYTEENRSKFPGELAELSDIVASYLGYKKYKAEAAIVNYYHMDSTLLPHTDHSEVNLGAPLLSFSFGQSAIFLIGSHNKSEEPTAIKVDSGDIIVMSKEARLCYHAVPRILQTTLKPWDNHCEELNKNQIVNFKYVGDSNKFYLQFNENKDNKVWRNFEKYIEKTRINVNVRQVLHDNQLCLDL